MRGRLRVEPTPGERTYVMEDNDFVAMFCHEREAKSYVTAHNADLDAERIMPDTSPDPAAAAAEERRWEADWFYENLEVSEEGRPAWLEMALRAGERARARRVSGKATSS